MLMRKYFSRQIPIPMWLIWLAVFVNLDEFILGVLNLVVYLMRAFYFLTSL